MKGIKEAMTLHHHPHSPLQNNLWCNDAESFLLKFFKACPYIHPFWCDGLRHVDLGFTVTTIILHSNGGGATTTITLHLVRFIIIVGGGGDRSQGVPSRRRRGFDVRAVILAHLLFFLRVAEDDDVAIIRRPSKATIEVAEELASNFLIP
jgi:hypothetical protein